MPCEICNDAVAFEDRRRVINSLTALDIQISANHCTYCKIISHVLDRRNVEQSQRVYITNADSDVAARATKGLNFTIFAPGQRSPSQFEFVMRNLRGLDAGSLPNVILSGRTYTGSQLVLEWAKRQIEECKSNHRSCKVEPHGLPDRVLWLGQRTTDDSRWLENDVRLYEPGVGETELYATLSHRWGGKQPLKLMKHNVPAFKTCIPWYDLPKTFREAINFTRRLGLRYLWIDSLCIIQDSKDDWETQAGNMASIYEHSFVTLAASVAGNADAGCFRMPPAFSTGYVTDGITKIGLTNLQSAVDLMKASPSSPLAFVRGPSKHDMPSERFPLLQRGWVHQERLLSPRILHFADDLVFECSWHIKCYCGKELGVASRSVESHPPKLQHANAFGNGPFKNTGGHLNAYARHWCNLIIRYSALHLTFESDRLPAIAGLAKQMARYMPEARYLSGIWTERLVVYLPWRRATKSLPVPSSERRLGPSWSWVTIGTGVMFPRGTFYRDGPLPGSWESSDLWATVIDIKFDHRGDDDFMSLKSGSLILRGILLEVKLLRLETDKRKETRVLPTMSIGKSSLVTQDYDIQDSDLNTEWIDMSMGSNVEPSPAQEMVPSSERTDQWMMKAKNVYLSPEESLESIRIHTKTFWAFCLGVWQVDQGSTHQYLLLEAADEYNQTFKRIGHGECDVGQSFFEEIPARVVITLIMFDLEKLAEVLLEYRNE